MLREAATPLLNATMFSSTANTSGLLDGSLAARGTVLANIEATVANSTLRLTRQLNSTTPAAGTFDATAGVLNATARSRPYVSAASGPQTVEAFDQLIQRLNNVAEGLKEADSSHDGPIMFSSDSSGNASSASMANSTMQTYRNAVVLLNSTTQNSTQASTGKRHRRHFMFL